MSEAFHRAVEWLYSLEAARGMDFKLERVALALEYLGRPQERFPAVHIAGTNGKGSVAAMIHAVLGAAGLRAGLYTSPHLVRVTERIRVGEREIHPEVLAEWVAKVRRAACARGVSLTFFEFLTALALDYFAAERVDIAVLEVGLGGRLDATNVVLPEVTAITTVGMDHEEFLGDTLEQVAAEKAGILKKGRPCAMGRVPAAVRAVVQRMACERGSPLYELGTDFSVEPVAAKHSSTGGFGAPSMAFASGCSGPIRGTMQLSPSRHSNCLLGCPFPTRRCGAAWRKCNGQGAWKSCRECRCSCLTALTTPMESRR